MTNVVAETNAADTRSDLGAAIKSAFSGGVQSGNAIARIAADLLVMIGEGNGSITFDTGDKSVAFDAETLGRYARGTLPSKADDAKAQDLPTASMMINAIADTADTVLNARNNMKAEQDAAKKAKANPILKAKHDAEAERLSTALNTLKTPIRRAFRLAAYVATSDAFDMTKASADNGKLVVPCLTGETEKDGTEVRKNIAITYATAREAFKSDSKKRAPQTTKAETGVAGEGDTVTATVTGEAVRKGGAQRAKLAEALAVISGLLSDLDGKPDHNEREAIARLYVTCEVLLDDDAMQRVADLRDERAEQANA